MSGNKMCEGLFVGAEVIGLTTSPVQTGILELLQPCVFSLPIFQSRAVGERCKALAGR